MHVLYLGCLYLSKYHSIANRIPVLVHKNLCSSTKGLCRGPDTVCCLCAVLVGMSRYHSQFGLSDSLSPHTRTPWLPSHPIQSDMEPASCNSTLHKLSGTFCSSSPAQHATVSTVLPFTGHCSWLLNTLTSSSLRFLWGHWHPVSESRVNSNVFLCVSFFPHSPFPFSSPSPHLFCYSVAAQYFQKWIRRGRRVVSGLKGWGWREGQVAGRLCSVAGLVKLIDEKGKLVFLAGWGFILLAALIHLSRFKVAVAAGRWEVLPPTARVLRRRLGCCTSCQMRSSTGWCTCNSLMRTHTHTIEWRGRV